jgi:hypothetical protein
MRPRPGRRQIRLLTKDTGLPAPRAWSSQRSPQRKVIGTRPATEGAADVPMGTSRMTEEEGTGGVDEGTEGREPTPWIQYLRRCGGRSL